MSCAEDQSEGVFIFFQLGLRWLYLSLEGLVLILKHPIPLVPTVEETFKRKVIKKKLGDSASITLFKTSPLFCLKNNPFSLI